jgi:tetratricopeptide (TPR) repeat protein
MPKLVFSTRNPKSFFSSTAPSGPRVEPVVITFAETQSTQAFSKFPLLIFFFCIAAFALAAFAYWLGLQQPASPAPAAQIEPLLSLEPAPVLAEAPVIPPVAPTQENPALIAPLPQKAISGRDFSANPPPQTVDIIPLLEKLPVGGAVRPRNASFSIDVDEAVPQRNLAREAEEAALAGQTDVALRLYSQMLRAAPDDAVAQHNMAALLLEKAAYYDEQGRTGEALHAYQRSLNYLGSDARATEGIKARIVYLKQQ